MFGAAFVYHYAKSRNPVNAAGEATKVVGKALEERIALHMQK